MKLLASSTFVYTLLIISVIEAAFDPPVCENLGVVTRRRVGEDFSVSCRYSVSDIEENYNVQFYKSKSCSDAVGRVSVRHDNSQVDPTMNLLPMTTNATTLNSYLEDTGRYSVSEEKTDENVTYTMTITGVQAVDLGTIGCQIVDVSGAPAYIRREVTSTLYVEGPPLATHFIVSDFCESRTDEPLCAGEDEDVEVELVSGEEFTFHENETVMLSFSMDYSNERPQGVRLFIGDRELPVAESSFAHTETIINNGSLVTITSLARYLRRSVAELEYQSNGEQIYAEITQHVLPVENVTVVERVHITFSPKEASCNMTSTSGDKTSDGTNLEIACKANGNPAVVATTWTQDDNEIDVDSNPEKYKVDSEVEDDLTTSTLTIFNAAKNNSGTYRVTFKNEYGAAKGEVKVTPKDVGGSAPWNSAPALTMMAAFILAVFTQD